MLWAQFGAVGNTQARKQTATEVVGCGQRENFNRSAKESSNNLTFYKHFSSVVLNLILSLYHFLQV